ncbi:MAG: hypothetical protein ACE5GC_06640 [Acidimicrobiia bacterium]
MVEGATVVVVGGTVVVVVVVVGAAVVVVGAVVVVVVVVVVGAIVVVVGGVVEVVRGAASACSTARASVVVGGGAVVVVEVVVVAGGVGLNSVARIPAETRPEAWLGTRRMTELLVVDVVELGAAENAAKPMTDTNAMTRRPAKATGARRRRTMEPSALPGAGVARPPAGPALVLLTDPAG